VPAKTILASIGNTPLVSLRNMRRRGMARVLLKLESFNPTGSLKDRIVDYILEAAERRNPAGTAHDHRRVVRQHRHRTGVVAAELQGRIYMPETSRSSGAESCRRSGSTSC
jgi:threonine dehydratase